MEPLNEGKPRLKGKKLDARMARLAGMIQEEHGQVKAAWAGALEHARNAGEWLVEAKWRQGHRSKWGKWKRRIMEKHGIAARTVTNYMYVARHWNDARIEEARAQGIVIDSINKFLKITRGHHPQALPKSTEAERERGNHAKDIQKQFADYLNSLDAYEVGILWATLDEVLAVANADLKERVCGHYGGPYYRHREEYYREQAAEREREEEQKRRAELDGQPKRIQRIIERRQVNQAALDGLTKQQVAAWNKLPVRGNTDPDLDKPRRGRRPKRT